MNGGEKAAALRRMAERAWSLADRAEAIRKAAEQAEEKAFAAFRNASPEAWAEAAAADGRLLRLVPPEGRTAEICLAAVRSFPGALDFVPRRLLSEEFCLEAVRRQGRALCRVPEWSRTPDLCMEAVRQDGGVLFAVPEYLKTAEICLAAAKSSPEGGDPRMGALPYVPDGLKTEEVCLECVRHCPAAMEFVPDSLKSAVQAGLEAEAEDSAAPRA